MAGTVIGGGDAAVGAGDFHVQVGIADLLADHLAHPHGAEGGIGDHERDLAAGGKARGHTGGVLLGNAHVQILVRQLLAEGAGLAGFADVHVHNQNIGILFANGYDLIAKPVAGGFFHNFAHLRFLLQHFTYCRSSSAIAC